MSFLRDIVCTFSAVAAVTLGSGALAAEIVIRAPEDLAESIKAASLVVSTNAEDEVKAQDLFAAALADYGRLTGALYDESYYGPVINIQLDGREAASIPPLSAPAQISKIVMTIQPGPRFVFARAIAEPLPPEYELPKGYQPGRSAKSGVIEQVARGAVSGWRDAGHAKADIASENITVDHQRRTMSSDLRFAPGPRLRFGTLNLRSESAVRPERVREIAGFPTGEVFSPEKTKKVAERLREAGTFRSVSLQEGDVVGPGDTLDVDLTLVDEKPRRIGAGIELFSQEGLTLSGFWMHRNLFGGAERLRVEAEVGGIAGNSGGEDYTLSARLERPATWTPDTDLYLDASVQDLDEPNYKQRNATIGAGVKHEFSDELTGELGIGYRYSRIHDDLGKRTTQFLLLPARLTWDTRDNELNAITGHYVDLQAVPFMGLNESVLGTRGYLDARLYRPVVSEDRLVLAGRLQAGTVLGADIDQVPPDMLFFSGGAGTVRGQKYQSLGVRLPGGAEVGGRSFLGLSGEARIKVKKDIGVVGFVDTGFVGEDAFGGGEGEWHSGAGLGVRYYTGFGPIRADIATPLGKDAGSRIELYIGIGQAF